MLTHKSVYSAWDSMTIKVLTSNGESNIILLHFTSRKSSLEQEGYIGYSFLKPFINNLTLNRAC